MILPDNIGMNLPYANMSEVVVHSWRPSHWYTFIWESDKSHFDEKTNELIFSKGGFQGGEGTQMGAEWYIEGLYEEITMGMEWYYDKKTNYLYYFHNISDKIPPSDDTMFIVTHNNVLFNISGNQTNPVKNVSIKGLTIRDTRYTYLDPHGLPSGGDWALARQGAITMEGSEYITIESNLFTRLDGNGISINGYNRYNLILSNDFEWIGESAMASWGYTSGLEDILPGFGPDGRDGNQPRFMNITNNLVHEIGIWQKQSSMWFQAQTCQTTLKNNVFFNGPRAAVNVNDGFGGDNHMVGNLLMNTCRESGDHGPWNSWDRVPFITTVRNGTASIIPDTNKIYNSYTIYNPYHSFHSLNNI